jgi:hypothetical protein
MFVIFIILFLVSFLAYDFIPGARYQAIVFIIDLFSFLTRLTHNAPVNCVVKCSVSCVP